MRILYSAPGTPIPGTHGGSVHALELCRALARRGHEVHLVALPSSAEVGDLAPGAGSAEGEPGRLIFHPLRRWLPTTLLEWTAGRRLRALASEVRPDVLVERFYTFGGAGIWAARSLGIPAVLEVNSPARPYPGSVRDALDRASLLQPVDRWRQRQLHWSQAIYTTSRHLVPPELQEEATVIVNGVDVDRFRPGEPVPETGPIRCAYVSSFRAWHGAEDLVAAVAICAEHDVGIQVTCIGRGPRWQAAREAAEAAGLTERVEFAGTVLHDQVPRYLAGAHVGVAPFTPTEFSALELGWFWSPIKIFEYLAAGLPVVTADIAELRDLLPGRVANFYRPGEPRALAEALMELEHDREAVRGMAVEARALAASRFTWNHQAAVVERLLNRVVGS